jgi:signal peptidase II
MKKRDWLWVLGCLPAVWAIDQLTKLWAVHSLHGIRFYGPVGLVLHRNPGAILGTFANLPPLLRVVSLSTGGAFLIFIYGVIQHLLPSRLMRLRIGMSVLLGGILGNVMDRILDGSVVDFIVIGSPSYTSPAFNFADAVQWVGYIWIVLALSKDGALFWPDENARKRKWINPEFQMKYCLILMANGLAFAMISGVFTYTFLKMTITDLVPGPSTLFTQTRFLIPFLQIYSIISVAFAVGLFLLGKVLSHRTAGPVYAFEKYMDDLLAGHPPRHLKFRAGDEFKHLEDLARRITTRLEERRAPAVAKTGSDGI